ncbi:MAG: hypothetical protein IJM50_05550 [Lachnospiraceae bacterium]|nr:hypothetical protein [Lachnospiraceae bacterium]
MGNILYCWYEGYLDAAFFELESSYSINTVLYYSNQSDPVNVSGGYVSPYVGQAFYKSGKTTGVTAGIVHDANYSMNTYSPYIYWCGLIQADRNMADGGDSGGVAYTLETNPSTGALTAYPLGIVRGPDPVWTLFTAAKWIHLATDIN